MPLTTTALLRRVVRASLVAGATAGGALFLLQHATLVPLIQRAEAYEHASTSASHGGHDHSDGWRPSAGIERTAFTALGTVLTGIAFAAIVLGFATLTGWPLDARRGALLGAAGFVCFTLAPSLGLPPQLPGAPAAELYAAQVWWVTTVVFSGAGLWLMFRSHASWPTRAIGVVLLLLPHIVGAPDPDNSAIVPAELSRQFAWWSVGTRLPFWLVLGALGGHVIRRADARVRGATL